MAFSCFCVCVCAEVRVCVHVLYGVAEMLERTRDKAISVTAVCDSFFFTLFFQQANMLCYFLTVFFS